MSDVRLTEALEQAEKILLDARLVKRLAELALRVAQQGVNDALGAYQRAKEACEQHAGEKAGKDE